MAEARAGEGRTGRGQREPALCAGSPASRPPFDSASPIMAAAGSLLAWALVPLARLGKDPSSLHSVPSAPFSAAQLLPFLPVPMSPALGARLWSGACGRELTAALQGCLGSRL